MLWSASSSNRVQSWGEDFSVVYSGASGDTHLITSLAGEILRLLAQRSATPEMLRQEMADIFENHDKDQAQVLIENILSELQNLYLVFNDSN
jgi:PqqD family protein of HPr-rel-A system